MFGEKDLGNYFKKSRMFKWEMARGPKVAMQWVLFPVQTLVGERNCCPPWIPTSALEALVMLGWFAQSWCSPSSSKNSVSLFLLAKSFHSSTDLFKPLLSSLKLLPLWFFLSLSNPCLLSQSPPRKLVCFPLYKNLPSKKGLSSKISVSNRIPSPSSNKTYCL